jgi:hypothetical protein
MWSLEMILYDGEEEGPQSISSQKLLDGKRYVWGRVVKVHLSGNTSGLTRWTCCLRRSKLGGNISGWQSDQVGQTLGAIFICSQRHNSTLSWLLILTSALPWGLVSLVISTAHSAALSQGHTGNPTFVPSDDLVDFFPILNRNYILILCSKYLSPIFVRAIQILLQLKHNSSALARRVKTNLLRCRFQTCIPMACITLHQPQSDSRFVVLPVSLFNWQTLYFILHFYKNMTSTKVSMFFYFL